MKRILTALILATFAFAACNDDDDSHTPKGPVTTFAGQLPTTVGEYTFEYDEQNRCTQIKEYSDVLYNIDYEKGIITLDGEEANVKFNKQGYVTELSQEWDEKDGGDSYKGSGTIRFEYNKEGQLVSMSTSSKETGTYEGEKYSGEYNNEYTYTWENGNLIKVVGENEEIEDGETYKHNVTYTVTYGQEENKAKQNTYAQAYVFDMEDADAVVLIGMFGKATSLFPTSILEKTHTEDYEGSYDYEDDYEVSYDLNEDGTIDTEYFNGYGYGYSYTTVGNASGKAVAVKNNADAKKRSFRSLFIKHHNRK